MIEKLVGEVPTGARAFQTHKGLPDTVSESAITRGYTAPTDEIRKLVDDRETANTPTGPEPIPLISEGQIDLMKAASEFVEELHVGDFQRSIEAEKIAQTCAYCHRRPGTTVEHFIPHSAGIDLSTSRVNMIPVCHECNAIKGGRWPNQKETERFFEYWVGELRRVKEALGIARAIQRSAQGTLHPGIGSPGRARGRHRGGRRRR